MTWNVIEGDAMSVLPTLEACSIQTVVTSPPYWGLRDYGTASWEGGDAECDHAKDRSAGVGSSTLDGGKSTTNHQQEAAYNRVCGKCGAVRVDSQLGLEATPEEYVSNLVAVFAEIRRVLRADGTVWLNLGDSYASQPAGNSDETFTAKQASNNGSVIRRSRSTLSRGLKPKDLVGIPWRVAFALQADGWYLRSDIIWSKPNPMPESVTDRPTKAHEYLFLLTKSARYYYDADAVREPQMPLTLARYDYGFNRTGKGLGLPGGASHTKGNGADGGEIDPNPAGRNIRSVWNIATEPFPDAHFATFPKKLVEPCVKAGTSEKGCCSTCGIPIERVVEQGPPPPEPDHRSPVKRLEPHEAGNVGAGNMGFRASKLSGQEMGRWREDHPDRTVAWSMRCPHVVEAVPCTVLDPFAGSGTTGVVALRLGRSFVGIELSPVYAEMARERIRNDAPLWNHDAEVVS